MAYIGAGISRFNTADELTVTGDAQIDGTTLVIDSTNNRVGVGTASPATALDVTGTVTADGIDSTCAAGDGNLALQAYHPTSTSARDIAKFQSNVGGTQVDQMVIGCDGNVDINGTVTVDGLISDSITNESSNLLIASTQSVTLKFDSDNNQTNREFNLQRNASTTILKAEESGDITFFADDGTTQALRWDASTQRLGLGTTSPGANLEIKSSGLAELRIDGGAVSSSVGPLIRGQHNNTDAFYIGTNSVVLGETPNQDVIIYGADSSSGNIRFYAGASTETARIRSGGGITFNGDTAAVNALDDYEEGTWTPSVRGSTTNGSFSGSNTVGFYTKIGDTVHAWFDCDGTISGAAGIIVFTGLPYASISTVEAVGQFMFSDLNVDGTRTNFVLYLGGNSTEMEIFQSKDDVSWTQVSISNESIGIRGQITYKTA
jgi:hypothetical protein